MSTQSNETDWDGGNPDPDPHNDRKEYSTKDCPYCGETIKHMPAHLRYNCEVVN